MRKCNHIRDLILTNYVDGEMDAVMARGVENHLMDCADCRAFFKEVKNNFLFLQQTPRQVPEGLWEAVKQNIERQNQPPAFEGFWEKLKGLLVFPRLVPVFASLALMLTVGSVAVKNIQIRQAQDRDQGEYLVTMLSLAGPSTQTAEEGPIEHYFL